MAAATKRALTASDVEFLAALRDELVTQDSCGNCDPRFWTVIDRYEEPCWSEQAEFWALVDDNGDVVGKVDYEIDCGSLRCVPSRAESKVVQDTLFLTLRECREHITRNRHNYKSPLPYVQTAVRSPQFERLIGILQQIDWESLAERSDDDGR